MAQITHSATNPEKRPTFWIMFICLIGALLLFFAPSFSSNKVLFANDGPLGANMAKAIQPPQSISGVWWNLNWIGFPAGTYVPSFTFFLLWGLGPVGFAKFYDPVCLLFLGISAWTFCKQMRWHPLVCLVVALAAMLNMNVFSNVCWGLGTRALCLGSIFLGLAAFEASKRHKYPWLFLVAGGLAVGMAVCEGADNGAIYSIYLAAYVALMTWQDAGLSPRGFGKAVITVGIIAVFAGLLAAQSLGFLVPTAVETVAHAQVTPESKQEAWDFATQWSLPPKEIIRVLIPGVFGYRMDTPNGGEYWGKVGEQPGWEQHHQGSPRYSGSGEYAGVIVLLIAGWAAANSFRASGTSFSISERRAIQFWVVAAFISVLFAFGRHAPFFKIIYSLPYFSTIRNPIKFMHPFHLAVLIIFGYGLQDLFRRMTASAAKSASMSDQLKMWWSKAGSFEKRWTIAVIGLFALSVLGFLMYSSASSGMMRYLAEQQFNATDAREIVSFSKMEIGLYLVFFAGSAAIFFLIVSGVFAGSRLKWAGVLIAVLLLIDMARANAPWVRYYDYKQKYASNPVIDLLANKPYEHRAATRLTPMGQLYLAGNNRTFPGLMNEWMQHLFQYYNIQAIDIIQWPRMPDFDKALLLKFQPSSNDDLTSLGRMLQLSNTRFILGMSGFLQSLNQSVDPVAKSFRVHDTFRLIPKPGVSEPKAFDDVTIELRPDGDMALFEYTNALPRCLLFSKWQVQTNDDAALKQLADRSFDPFTSVVVSSDVSPAAQAGGSTNLSGNVEFVGYEPKRIALQANATVPSVLLLNDRYDPDWHVFVDGTKGKLLRCNYIMRGVALAPGNHKVEFRYEPTLRGLHSTLAGLALGIVLCFVMPFVPARREGSTSPSAS